MPQQPDKTVLSYHANGKLLLTGEYFVLDGARALALPARLGQRLQITENESYTITWRSTDADGATWFEALFSLPAGECVHSNDAAVAARLSQILQAIDSQRPGFWKRFTGLQIETQLEFPPQWGLGTSSTLIANLAEWSGVDAWQLLRDTFGGSGYDLACAQASGPLVYQLQSGRPFFQSVAFQPPFAQQLYFVYLQKKQDSRAGIARYRACVQQRPDLVVQISELTDAIIFCKTLSAFEQLIQHHEQIIAESLALPRAKELYFSGFWGEIKSLGAWGGDFVLATSHRPALETLAYFNESGFPVVIPYEKMVL